MGKKLTAKKVGVETEEAAALLSMEEVSLADLQDHIDPENPRVHGDRNKQAIGGSLSRFGAGRSIVLDKDNNVVAGNGTVQQALASGAIKKVIVVEGDAETLLAVRRKDWTPGEAKAYSIADNQTSDLAENDYTILAAHLKALREVGDESLIQASGFTSFEVETLLAQNDWKAGSEPEPLPEATLDGKLVRFTEDQWGTVSEAIQPIHFDGITLGEAIETALVTWVKMQIGDMEDGDEEN